MRYLRIGIDIALTTKPNMVGGWVMIDLEIYFDVAMVVIALAVDLVAIYLYRETSLGPNEGPGRLTRNAP